MRPRDPETEPHAELRRFVDAEQAGRDEEAEEALFALFAELLAAEPPSGFADRVMARWAVEQASLTTARKRRSWPFWVALVLCAVPVVGAALYLPPIVRALAGLWSLASAVQWVAGGLVMLGQGLGSVVHAGARWVAAWEILAAPFRTPAAAGVSAACLVVASLAFRALRDLVTRKRSWAYVDPL
jgi:hypothetical protein